MSPDTISRNTDAVAAVRQVVNSGNPIGVAAAQRGMAARDDFRDRLSQIAVPTLVVCGEHDAITPTAGMLALAQALPNGDFSEIHSAGHLAPLEQSDRVTEAIRTWLNAE
jgi:pimeloyl-ACP methyl ester carboxylesterase